jgi:hypothetical protein
VGTGAGLPPLRIRFKEHPHPGWSYPVGVEILTRYLGDIPHSAPQPLWFSHGDALWLKDRRRRATEDLPISVLEATYTTFAVGPPDPERPVWTLHVNSVPSSSRRWVKACLVSEGLARLAQWLRQPFSDTALQSAPVGRLLFREGRHEILWERRSSRFEDPIREVLPCEQIPWP